MLKKVLMLSIVLASCSVSAQQGETKKDSVADGADRRWKAINDIVRGGGGEYSDLGGVFANKSANLSKGQYIKTAAQTAKIEKDSIGSGSRK